MDNISKAYYKSPIGAIEITADDDGITRLDFVKNRKKDTPGNPHIKKCLKELDEYFKGKRKRFSVSIVLTGTAFQTKVWNALMTIPYGKTASYLNIANLIGKRNAMRAVGGANHRNPVSIIVPCHRVISHDGSIGGYGGGLSKKRWLLEHEKNNVEC